MQATHEASGVVEDRETVKAGRNMQRMKNFNWSLIVALALVSMPMSEHRAFAANEAEGHAKSQSRTNRLAKESSPYLLLHAHNPVDWYPWGSEAFDKAKKEGKLVFLSVGYSSCYWCHVMERKVFMNEAIAKQLNQDFVCVKVDREERPDIDDIYMTALQVYYQAIGSPSSGGWPLSIFLTPDGKPSLVEPIFHPKTPMATKAFRQFLRS